jgi:hypothetical protein
LTIDRSALLCSLSEQRRQFADSIVLTPVDSLRFSLRRPRVPIDYERLCVDRAATLALV